MSTVDIEDIKRDVRAALQEAQDALDTAIEGAVNNCLADAVDTVLDRLTDHVECPSDKPDEHADGLLTADEDGNESLADDENPDDVRATLVAVFTAGWDAAMAEMAERIESAQNR